MPDERKLDGSMCDECSTPGLQISHMYAEMCPHHEAPSDPNPDDGKVDLESLVGQLADIFDAWAAKLAAGKIDKVIGEMRATAAVNRLRNGLGEQQDVIDAIRKEARLECDQLRGQMAEARKLLEDG